MLDLHYFLANLVCVFVPLFGMEIYRNRADKSLGHTSWMNRSLVVSILASSVLCSLFYFAISKGISLNLSIVPLTIGFFVLPIRMGLLVLVLFAISEIVLTLAHGDFTIQVLHSVLLALPQALCMLFLFALIMCICSIWTRHQSFSLRATGFVISLLLYTFINFAYVFHIHHFRHFNFVAFAGFVVVINFTFILAARLLVAVQSAHIKHLEDVRAEKFALISQLAASVAHEIRNPITVVKGFTQLMLSKDYDKNKSHEFLLMMQQELSRAESVISDYLQIAKGPVEGSEAELNLSLIVMHVINVLQAYAHMRNVTLQSSLDTDVIIYGNHVSVTQAVMNLVKNAIESHDKIGSVTVCLTSAGENVELEIADSGRGIPSSKLSILGQPYYSTKTEGTGLGLTLVYKVINDMNGEIQVKSQENVGTKFVVRIPRVKVRVG